MEDKVMEVIEKHKRMAGAFSSLDSRKTGKETYNKAMSYCDEAISQLKAERAQAAADAERVRQMREVMEETEGTYKSLPFPDDFEICYWEGLTSRGGRLDAWAKE